MKSSGTKARRAAEKRALESWTAPVGTRVEVTRDDGSTTITTTRSLPWKVGDGTPVILLEGISGGYLLTRVRVLPAGVEVSS